MTKLYTTFKTNSIKQKQNIKKVEILYDLQGFEYEINDIEYCKHFVIICGSCEFCLQKGTNIQTFYADTIDTTIEVHAGIKVLLKKFTKDIKIAVEYFKEV